MRCKQCDYRLWNLTSRQCPECGTEFVPSDFEYIPGSVAFCCPHCDQAYYGSDAGGQLVPKAFECAQCQRDIHMDEMVLRPAEGVSERQTLVDVCPWLERKKRGLFKAWFSTVGMAMVSPVRLARTLPSETRCGQAWWFALLTTTACMAVGMVPFLLVGIFAALGGGGTAGPWAYVGVGGTVALIALAITFVGVLIYVVLWGAVTHGVLHLSGDHSHSRLMTYQALCYSNGSIVLAAIPCVGFYFGWIWPIISGILMIKEAQKVQGWRAALSVLTFPCVLLFGFVLLYGGAIYFTLTSLPQVSTTTVVVGAISPEAEQTSTVLTAVLTYANDNFGLCPEHPIELVNGDYLAPSTLVLPASLTSSDTINVAGIHLRRFLALDDQRRWAVVDSAIQPMSSDHAMSRFGDFLFFTYDVDATETDPGTWLVVAWPDPISNAYTGVPTTVWVGQADGTVHSIDGAMFDSERDKQNQLRIQQGLPVLPNLPMGTPLKPRPDSGE